MSEKIKPLPALVISCQEMPHSSRLLTRLSEENEHIEWLHVFSDRDQSEKENEVNRNQPVSAALGRRKLQILLVDCSQAAINSRAQLRQILASLSADLSDLGPLLRRDAEVILLSSIRAAGESEQKLKESEFDIGQKFVRHSDEFSFLSEKLVREEYSSKDLQIIRCGPFHDAHAGIPELNFWQQYFPLSGLQSWPAYFPVPVPEQLRHCLIQPTDMSLLLTILNYLLIRKAKSDLPLHVIDTPAFTYGAIWRILAKNKGKSQLQLPLGNIVLKRIKAFTWPEASTIGKYLLENERTKRWLQTNKMEMNSLLSLFPADLLSEKNF